MNPDNSNDGIRANCAHCVERPLQQDRGDPWRNRAHDGRADAPDCRLPSLAKLAAKAQQDYGDAYCGGQIEDSLRKVLDV
jgi:hypothetical protein